MIENAWVQKVFEIVKFGGVSPASHAQPLLGLLTGLEYYIDRLILGDVDAIYLNVNTKSDVSGVEFSDTQGENSYKLFDYESLGDRFMNKPFLYLYLGDVMSELIADNTKSDKE